MTVDEFLDRVSGAELSEWGALLALEGRERKMVADGIDPDLASRMVWGVLDNGRDR